MSKPTKEELTALLQTWKLSCEKDCEKECNVEFMEDECKPCFDAIHSLIEKFFEWQERAITLDRFYNDKKRPSMIFSLIEEIRDFGKEDGDEPK